MPSANGPFDFSMTPGTSNDWFLVPIESPRYRNGGVQIVQCMLVSTLSRDHLESIENGRPGRENSTHLERILAIPCYTPNEWVHPSEFEILGGPKAKDLVEDRLDPTRPLYI
jgi:hypothetical protein